MSKSLIDRNGNQPIVLIVTGPCGSGKTTISSLIAQNHNFVRLCGDDIKEELFPGIVNIQDYPEGKKKVFAEIFERAKKHFENGDHVLIDYIMLGQKRLEEYKNTFSDHLQIRVLLASREVNIHRDQVRECWTSGEQCVRDLYDEFTGVRDFVGAENYIDSSEETPEETYLKHFAAWLPGPVKA